MSPLDWFKKEKPMLSMQSMGGGAAGLMISGTSEPIVATGGTKSTPGDGYIYHVFTSSGSLNVTQGKGSEYNFLVVGGGGGGGFDRGGGGGAGGVHNATAVKMGPNGTYPVTIGGGGSGAPSPGSPVSSRRGNSGGYSNFNGTGAGGGGGGGGEPHPTNPGIVAGGGSDGGSGGGARLERESGGTSSNTPNSGVGPYGNPGRGSPQGEPFAYDNGGGGGGAGLLTTPANTSPSPPGNPTTPAFEKGSYGGMGIEIPWVPGTLAGVASPTNTAWFAAGGFGGGSTWAGYPGANVLPAGVSPSPTHTTMDYRWSGAGIGGGNSPTGTNPSPLGSGSGYPGVDNTGSGGGGASGTGPTRSGGTGGSGVVVIRYAVAS